MKKKKAAPGAAGQGSFTDSEFPLLGSLQLYAANTTGDGNCLFRSLSDQLYGDESHHREIRSAAVSYLKAHADRFQAFVGEFGETFEVYVKRIAQDAVYGGHMEIVAAAEHYCADIVIYQADSMYVVQPLDATAAKRLHIAYHTWEHYSSVRNRSGPHSGLPEVAPQAGGFGAAPPSNEVPRWKVEIVLRSCPDVSEKKILHLLKTKDYGAVIEELLMEEHIGEVDGGKGEEDAAAAEVTASPPLETAAKAKTRPTAREKRDLARKKALDRKLNKHKRRADGPSGAAPPAQREVGAVDIAEKTIYI